MGILNEYEDVLIGNRKKVSSCYFIFDKKGNERVAIAVIRYALEKLLGWTPEIAIDLLNPNYIKLMKLDHILKYIAYPSDVSKEDTDYLLYLLYPKLMDYDIQKYTLRVYESVLKGEGRYPKDYMYGYLGMLRAKICLQYSINKNCCFKSVDELYKFFGSRECIKFLKEQKLHQLYINFYETPLEYMHDSMPTSIKNEFLLHNYLFMYQYRILKEQQKRNENAEKRQK